MGSADRWGHGEREWEDQTRTGGEKGNIWREAKIKGHLRGPNGTLIQ